MPQNLSNLSLPMVVAFLVAFVAAFTRIFSATKPFWGLFPGWLQVLAPAAIPSLTALGSGLAGVKTGTDLVVVFITSAALLLPGIPSHRSSAPLPSNSAKPPSVPPLAAAGLLMLCMVFSLGACAALKDSVWPTVAKCAPSPQNVINSVTQALLGGGDYETQLEHLGEQYGMNVVVCVVDDLVKQWGSPTAKLTAETVEAKGRGQAFLAHVGTKVER